MAKNKNELPEFVRGVLETLNCFHWKLPTKGNGGKESIISFLCGYGADVVTANKYKYGFRWNEKKERYEAVKIK